MSAEKNKALIRRLAQALNTRNWTVLDELLAPNFVNHNPASGEKPGLKGHKEAVISIINAFPDLKFIIKDMIAEGDKVAIRATFSGTHRGEFMGIPPTNKWATVQEIGIVRIVNGKVIEEWSNSDSLGMLQQLGVIPPIKQPKK